MYYVLYSESNLLCESTCKNRLISIVIDNQLFEITIKKNIDIKPELAFDYIDDGISFFYNNKSYLLFYTFKSTYNNYNYYNTTKTIIINNDIANNIYAPFKLKIVNDQIVEGEAFINGKIGTSLKNHDIIQIGLLKMIYNKSFIMMNEIYECTLDQLEMFYDDIDYDNNNYILDIQYNFEKPHLEIIKDIDGNDHVDKQSLIDIIPIIGPTITMSMASLSIGFINIINSENDGRPISAKIVFIIFPLMMIFSIVFWQIIQYLMRKRKQKAREIRDNNKLIIHYENEVNKIKEYQNTITTNNQQLMLNYENFKGYRFDNRVIEAYSLLIGKYNASIDNVYSGVNKDILKVLRYQTDLCLTLKKDANILIIDDGTQLHNIIAQLLYNLNYHKVILVIYDPNQYFRYGFMHQIDKHYFTKIDELMNSIKQLDNDKIYIMLNIDDNIDIDFNFYCRIFINRNYLKINAITHIVDYNKMLYFDGCKYYEFIKGDNYNDLSKLNTYRILVENKIEKSNTFFNFYKDIDNIKKLKDDLYANIGYDDNNELVKINLHPKADGPHGLIIGTTGSGKSELIVTLLLSLICNYNSDYLNIIIFDFKGTNLIQNFTNFPHLIHTISNVDLNVIGRALNGMRHQCILRQKLFDKQGVKSKKIIEDIDDYNRLSSSKLPRIVIVVDEFAEVKKRHPDVIDEILSIARIGRSLGFHLIFATQKAQGTIDNQINSNINYRICMRVTDVNDSYDLLGNNKALYFNTIGEFILNINSINKHGYCTYSKHSINMAKYKSITYFKSQYEHQYQKFDLLPKSINQLSYLATKYKAKATNKIWYEAINNVTYKNIETLMPNKDKNHVVLGIYDDIVNVEQGIEYLNINNSHKIIIDDLMIKNNLLFIILKHLIKNSIKCLFLTDNISYYDKNIYATFVDIKDYRYIDFLINNLKENCLIILDINNISDNYDSFNTLINKFDKHNTAYIVLSNIKSSNSNILSHLNSIYGIGLSKESIYRIFSIKCQDLKSNQGYKDKPFILLKPDFKLKGNCCLHKVSCDVKSIGLLTDNYSNYYLIYNEYYLYSDDLLLMNKWIDKYKNINFIILDELQIKPNMIILKVNNYLLQSKFHNIKLCENEIIVIESEQVKIVKLHD